MCAVSLSHVVRTTLPQFVCSLAAQKLTPRASPAQFAFKRLAPQSGLLSEDLRIMAEHLGGAALEAYEAAMRRVESEGAFNPLEEALSPADDAQARLPALLWNGKGGPPRL